MVRKATNPDGRRSYFQRVRLLPFVYLVQNYSISKPTVAASFEKKAAAVGRTNGADASGLLAIADAEDQRFEVATMLVSEPDLVMATDDHVTL
jgi:hypothetical protein